MTCPDFEVLQSILLQCTRCGQSESMHLEPAAAAELDHSGKAQIHCSACKMLADFTRPPTVSVQAGNDPNLIVTAQELFAIYPETKQVRRHHFRICPKNMMACIQKEGLPDIAEVVDYSRTGVRVLSSALYQLGMLVEVAIDYTAGATNIFQPARVVSMYRRPLPGMPGEYELAYQCR